MKTCCQCHITKPFVDFPPDLRNNDGLDYRCRSCKHLATTRYRQNNPEKIQALYHKRRTQKTGAGGSFTAEEWEIVKALQDYSCNWCGRSEPEITLTRDHIIPVTKGGSGFIENIQALCGSCNSKKNNRLEGGVQEPLSVV